MHTSNYFFRFFFTFLCFFKCSIFADFPNDEMTNVEKIKVKYLFEKLFKQDSFAYSLFFDKPISFSEVLFPVLPWSVLIKILNIEEYVKLSFSPELSSDFFEEAWNIWEKHQSKLLNQEKYLFIKKEFEGKPILLLINIEQFHNKFNQNLEFFQHKFNNPDLLIQKIKDSTDLDAFLDNISLGILLGYGVRNSELFEERESKERKMRQLIFLSPSSNIKKELQNQIDHLWEILRIKDDNYYFTEISLPFCNIFASDQNDFETKALNKKYKAQAKEISQIIYTHDWFEKIILKLKN